MKVMQESQYQQSQPSVEGLRFINGALGFSGSGIRDVDAGAFKLSISVSPCTETDLYSYFSALLYNL